MCKNEDDTEPIKNRYPFHGFYRPLLAEMEEIEAERAREQAAKPQSPESTTTTEIPNTIPQTESAAIKLVPRPAVETAPAETMSAPVQEDTSSAATTPEAPAEEPQPAEEPAWISDLIGDEFKQWEPGLVAIEAMTGTGKTIFVLEYLIKCIV